MTTTIIERGEGGVSRRDTASFDEFVRARLPHLLRFGLVLTGSDHAAADLVQDALERTLVRWRRVVSEDPEGYVRRVMINQNISTWRRLSREHLVDVVPERGYVDSYRDEPVFAALRQLAPRQRAVIALRYYLDLTEAQTAQALNCSVGTVKRQSSDAMARLRVLLQEEERS